jgi:hypothetical protein
MADKPAGKPCPLPPDDDIGTGPEEGEGIEENEPSDVFDRAAPNSKS